MEEKYRELEKILVEEIDKKYFCLGDVVEDASCIQYIDGYWQVFDYIRGNKYDLFEFKKFEDAANELICRITKTKKQEDSLSKKVEQLLNDPSINEDENSSNEKNKVIPFVSERFDNTDPLTKENDKVATRLDDSE